MVSARSSCRRIAVDRWRARAAGLVVLLLCAAWPLKAQTLRWASRGDAQSMDPHAALEGLTVNLNALVYDALVDFDRDEHVVPALAASWKTPEPTRWIFTLRGGVHFQDGTPLTADDVVFSIERAQQAGSPFTPFALPLGKVQRIGAQTVELRQAQPNPVLLEQLAFIRVMSRAWTLAHHAEHVPSLAAQQESYTALHAMGTGRYALVQREPGVRTVFERQAGAWGAAAGNIRRVVFTPIASDATRSAALTAGDIDFTQDLPPQDVERLARDPAVRVSSAPEYRIIFLGFDQFRDELAGAGVRGRNPFKDVRVREAFFRAIDVELLKSTIMRGQARPTACMSAAASGCLASALEVHPPPDLVRARKLMAEAGYADGFELTLDCPNDRYVNDRALCVALVGMLARINVRLKVDAMSKLQYFPKLLRFDSSFFLYGWGALSPDGQFLLDPVLHSPQAASGRGSNNLGRYADAALDRLIEAAGVEPQPARRAQLMREAQQRAHDQYYYVPLHRQVLSWAGRANLDVVITPTNFVRVDWMHLD